MKKISLNIILFCPIVCMSICGCEQKIDTASEMAAVKLVVDNFETFWETEDMALLSKIMAHDSDMVNYGTDATEIFKGWEEFESAVAQMIPALENMKITVRDQSIKINPSGEVAWFSEIWDWDLLFGGQQAQIPNQRLTGVLEKRNGNWVIVQFHNSVPVVATE
ncbi:MAG: nuclear transport factor 2 family protein [Bacteroidetes bacterium]|nr:nuclear transport factor 2 family protein [Bacteroidota bacterium]